jgi:predicted lysophospholipase L1 biosynthesis ABC-type transport system permease subunit
MGKALLICRLAAKDLQRRKTEAVMLLLAITAAAATLTLALLLHAVTSRPYQSTRAATAGPDVVAAVFPPRPDGGPPAGLASLTPLTRAGGVTGHSGPYPVVLAVLRAHGHIVRALAEGRDRAPAPVDQPKLTQGRWIGGGEVVVERSFADALGITAGDRLSLNGRAFTVAGIAVTAADAPYPEACFDGCDLSDAQLGTINPGLVWLARSTALSLATATEMPSYVVNLKLADPAQASAFVTTHSQASPAAPLLTSWQDLSQEYVTMAATGQNTLQMGSWLLGLLAAGGVAVVVAGRMAEQARRVGLLKAVGGTPGLVAGVLLAEYVALAIFGAMAGLVTGGLAAPALTTPGAGLVGAASTPPITLSTVALVAAAALAVAAVAAFFPAIRAAHTSTVSALAGSARPPRRRARLIAISARLPVPLLLGLRVAARRPRRMTLTAASILIPVTTIVAVLTAHASRNKVLASSSGLTNPVANRANEVILVLTVVLLVLAAVITIFTTWATALDARHSSALARAVGATPAQIAAGLSAAQMLPALPAAILGIPAGIGLYAAVNTEPTMTIPPAWWLLTVILATLAVVAGLTAVPARTAARRPVTGILQSEVT